MKYQLSIAALAAVATAAPAIVKARQAITDVGILNYALTLEHLEDKFYREGLANYTQADFIAAGFADPFYANIKEVSADETAHVAFLSGALGAAAVEECTYSFPSTDVASFVGLASVLEGVGVAAYLGAAADIASKDYLTAAGSILTVESRHNAYIRAGLKQSPFPQAFDTGLDFDEVYTLAASFIVSCPTGNADKPLPPLKAFPALAASSASAGAIKSGDEITLSTTATKGALQAAFIGPQGPIFGDLTAVEGGFKTVVPEGINGQTYVVLINCKDKVTDETIIAGPAIVEVTNEEVTEATSDASGINLDVQVHA